MVLRLLVILKKLTMPVAGSTCRARVSTAITCVLLSFHGQYFLQFAVETSSHEYSNSCCDSKNFILAVEERPGERWEEWRIKEVYKDFRRATNLTQDRVRKLER